MSITVDYVGNYKPYKGSKFASGYDLRASVTDPVKINPGEYVEIKTGIQAQPPIDYVGLLFIRSGLSKRGLRLTTGVSVIDPDYTGDITCCVYNDSDETQTIYDGDRIAQIVYTKCADVIWNKVDALRETERGDGGFGSTGR